MKKKSIGRDLSLGSLAEQKVIKILTDSGVECCKNNDKTTRSFWDIETKEGLKFEVKYDLYSSRSGNIAIEFFNPKSQKPSGLGCTQADFWAHVLPGDECWICRVAELKKFCEETKPLKVVTGGDDNSSMYIFKKDVILAVFTKVDENNIKNVIGL